MRAATFILVATVVMAAQCTPSPRVPALATRHDVRSNVLRGDYAGSAACAKCHENVYERWANSPMHDMTRGPSDATIQAPWSGTALRFKDDSIELVKRGDDRFVQIHSARFGDAAYRVTRVIGGHYREDYAGVAVGGGTDEMVLPISYLRFNHKFRYKGYSVMSRERPGVAAGPAWNRTCIFCHNTEPYFSDVLSAFVSKHAAYQGELVDPLLPATLRWRAKVDDAAALAADFKSDVERLTHAPTPETDLEALAWRDIDATRSAFAAKDLIEVGIGCEACHGGSREHAIDPASARTSMSPHTAAFHFDGESGPEADVQAQRINRACSRCHQVLFSRYPFTWEGARRDQNPGGSHINSGEGRDFLLGACSKHAACTLCHDPHDGKLRNKNDDVVCTQCHTKFVGEAARAHTHHDPNGAGGRCEACHMPKKNMSLDGHLTPYHRIGSPTDSIKQLDRPFECALCHDKTVREIAGDVERLWGKRIDTTILAGVYGSVDANVIDATLARGKPHEQAVALALLGQRKRRSDAPAIAEQLQNPYPLIRFYAESALESVLGEPSPLDLYTTDDEIRLAAAAWLAKQRL